MRVPGSVICENLDQSSMQRSTELSPCVGLCAGSDSKVQLGGIGLFEADRQVLKILVGEISTQLPNTIQIEERNPRAPTPPLCSPHSVPHVLLAIILPQSMTFVALDSGGC